VSTAGRGCTRAELTRVWSDALNPTACVPLSDDEIDAFLHDLVDRLVGALGRPEFSAQPAADVGARLVQRGFVDEHSLGRTVEILGPALPAQHELRGVDGLPGKVMSVLGALASGFATALRRRTLDQQEDVKRALLRAGDGEGRRIPGILGAAAAEACRLVGRADAARQQRARLLIESYMAVLARSGRHDAAAAEAFPLGEAVRGHAVQRALALSGARSVAATPKLAELARREQDMARRITALLERLNEFLARPREQRDEAAVGALRTGIDQLRAAHEEARNALAAYSAASTALTDPVH